MFNAEMHLHSSGHPEGDQPPRSSRRIPAPASGNQVFVLGRGALSCSSVRRLFKAAPRGEQNVMGPPPIRLALTILRPRYTARGASQSVKPGARQRRTGTESTGALWLTDPMDKLAGKTYTLRRCQI